MRSKVILAADFADLQKAHDMVKLVNPYIGMLKIGLELFTSCHKEAFSLGKDFNLPIFLDLKLNDVGATVTKTIDVLCNQLQDVPGQHFLSIHCFNGKDTCQKAVQAVTGSNLSIVGITLLSSLGDSDVRSFGFRDGRAGPRTIDLAFLAHEKGGISNFVCAPPQVKLMRKYFESDIKLIVPGIREGDVYPTDDHKRFGNANKAFREGADWIVVGRPITQATDPEAAAKYFKDISDKYN
jgi:orotidine-5'-phosphate decarboxylase